MLKQTHICLKMVGRSDWIGGAVYIQNLVKAIASLPEEERDWVRLSVSARSEDIALVEPVRGIVDRVHAQSRTSQIYLKLCKELAAWLPFVPLGWLNPAGFDFVYPEVASARAPFGWGGWIPDFQHVYLPHLFSEKEIRARNAIFQRLAREAPVVVLSSRMAQDDFARLYPQAAPRSQVMHFVTCHEPDWFDLDPLSVQKQYGLPDRFFLISNQFWKHKDHSVVIEALGLLQQAGIRPTVVCTGPTADRRNTEYYPALVARIRSLNLEEQVRVLGVIPRIEQVQLMRRCLAVIQPSLFEGWSTVVEDARSLGKPMLLSDFPVHIEQNPPQATYFERSNPEQLARLLGRASTALEPGPDPTWENLARQNNAELVQTYGRRFLEILALVR